MARGRRRPDYVSAPRWDEVTLALGLLIVGFCLNSASAFTSTYTRMWGPKAGQWASIALRDVLGIPVWIAGFGLAASLPSPRLIPLSPILDGLGWVAIAIGGILIIAALRSLGARAAAPSAGDTLVEQGPYRYIRHPIHAGTFLEFLGLAILRPSLPVLLACAIGVAWLPLQSWLEELDLLQRMPQYALYRQRVPPFFPSPGPGGGKRSRR